MKHVHGWPNSKYEYNNEILCHPSIVPGGGKEQANCFPVFHLQIIVKRGVVEAYVASPRYVGAMPRASPNFLCQCNSGYFIPNGSNTDCRGDGKTSDTTSIVSFIFFSYICCVQSEKLRNLKIALHILRRMSCTYDITCGADNAA